MLFPVLGVRMLGKKNAYVLRRVERVNHAKDVANMGLQVLHRHVRRVLSKQLSCLEIRGK